MPDNPISTTTLIEAAPNPNPTIAVTPAPVAPVVEAVQAPVTPVEAAPAPVAAPAVPASTVLSEGLDKPPVAAPTTESAPAVVETPKPAGAQTTTEPTKNEDGQSAEPAPPPVYDAFNLPEGMSFDNDRLSKFTDVLSKLEVEGKVPHEFAQKFGQEAVDLHVSEVTRAVDDLQKLYQTSWDRQRTEWKDSFLKDPEIGGNRFQTTVDSALNFIRTHGGTAENQQEFRNLMETSGLGNHPAMIRLLANAGRAMAEGKPLAATTTVTTPKSKTATLYGKSGS